MFCVTQLCIAAYRDTDIVQREPYRPVCVAIGPVQPSPPKFQAWGDSIGIVPPGLYQLHEKLRGI